jgi:uncharacterized protein (TIRG00374 family)
MTGGDRGKFFTARRAFSVALGVVVGGSFIYTIATHIDLRAVRSSLIAVNAGWAALAVTMALAGFVVRALRWWVMLRTSSERVRFRDAVRVYFSSFALNNTLPLRLGDALRTFGFSDVLGCTSWAVLGTLITERMLDLLVLISIGEAVFHLLPATVVPGGLAMVMQGMTAVAITLLVGVFVLNRPLLRALERGRGTPLASRFQPLERLRCRAIDVLAAVARSSNVRVLPTLSALSIAGWLLEASVFICVMAGLGVRPDPAAALLGFGLGTLATMLPGPPGHFGTFDFFAIRGFTVAGMDTVSAAATAFLAHFLIWAPVTIVGIALFLAGNRGGSRAGRSRRLPFTASRSGSRSIDNEWA